MEQGIHTEYKVATVRCSCGETFTTRSTESELRVDICSKCHPFYTGKQKLVDAGGRVERFARRYGKGKTPAAEAWAWPGEALPWLTSPPAGRRCTTAAR